MNITKNNFSIINEVSDENVKKAVLNILQDINAYVSDKEISLINWSDFEIGLKTFYDENEISEEIFIKCLIFFNQQLVDYLRKEENEFDKNFNYKKYTSFLQMILSPYVECKPIPRNNLENSIINVSNTIQFLSFNYTNTMELIIKNKEKYEKKQINAKFSKVVHIHGTLKDSAMLGIDSLKQFKNQSKATEKIENYFVKLVLN